MKYNFKDLGLRDFTEKEKTQFEEEGFIGDEGGDGYISRTIATYEKDYELPYGKNKFCEILGVTMTQLVVGGIFDKFSKKVIEGLKGCDKKVFFLIEPTIASMGCYDNYVVFDDFVEAIEYYKAITSFGASLKDYKS